MRAVRWPDHRPPARRALVRRALPNRAPSWRTRVVRALLAVACHDPAPAAEHAIGGRQPGFYAAHRRREDPPVNHLRVVREPTSADLTERALAALRVCPVCAGSGHEPRDGDWSNPDA